MKVKDAGKRRNPKWCRSCHNAARRVVPRYVYDLVSKSTAPNPSTRPKSKVR